MSRILTGLVALTCLATPVVAQEQAALRAAEKDPTVATLLSLLITGAGQMYSGETGRGLAMLGISIAAPVAGAAGTVATCGDLNDTANDLDDCNLTPLLVGVGVSLATKIWSVVDAGGSAKRMNQRRMVRVGVLPVQVQPVLGVGRGGATQLGLSVALVR